MEHKITIEILIKTDFLKPEEKPTSKVHALQINPEIVNSLIPQLIEVFKKDLPQEVPKEKDKKTKSKKVVKK